MDDDENGPQRPHSHIEDENIFDYKKHFSKDLASEDHQLKRTSDSSKSLSDSNVTKLSDPVPIKFTSQPVSVSQVRPRIMFQPIYIIRNIKKLQKSRKNIN